MPVGEVAEVADVGRISAEGSGIPIEDGGQLLAGEPAVRGEGGVRRAVDDTVDIGPDHGTVIVGADVEILKVGADGDRGAAGGAIEDGDQLGAGHGAVGGKLGLAHAADEAEVIGKVHGVGGPGAHVAARDVLELGGVGLRADGDLDHARGLDAGGGDVGHGDGGLAHVACVGEIAQGGDVVVPLAGGVGVILIPVVGGADAMGQVPQEVTGGGLAEDHGGHGVGVGVPVEVRAGKGEAGAVALAHIVVGGGGRDGGVIDQDLQAAVIDLVAVG